MTFWLALRRLLPLLAVLSLALTPVTASAATVGMYASMAHGHHEAAMGSHGMAGVDHHAAMGHYASVDMAGMLCCPKAKAPATHCGKGCPLMALCLAGAASLLPAVLSIPMPVATRASLSWPERAAFASRHGAPLPEPPRA